MHTAKSRRYDDGSRNKASVHSSHLPCLSKGNEVIGHACISCVGIGAIDILVFLCMSTCTYLDHSFEDFKVVVAKKVAKRLYRLHQRGRERCAFHQLAQFGLPAVVYAHSTVGVRTPDPLLLCFARRHCVGLLPVYAAKPNPSCIFPSRQKISLKYFTYTVSFSTNIQKPARRNYSEKSKKNLILRTSSCGTAFIPEF